MSLQSELMADEETDMAPMIDMVFLLLVFFMIASTMNNLEKPKIDMPIADNATIPKDINGRRIVTVKKDGKYYLGNTQRELEEIGPIIEDDVKQAQARGIELKLLLRGDATVHHKEVREVMKVAAANGAVAIIFTAYGAAE